MKDSSLDIAYQTEGAYLLCASSYLAVPHNSIAELICLTLGGAGFTVAGIENWLSIIPRLDTWHGGVDDDYNGALPRKMGFGGCKQTTVMNADN